MPSTVMTLSLLSLLVAVILENGTLFAVAVVSSLASLTAAKGVPRWPIFLFWSWVNLVLLYLIWGPSSDGTGAWFVFGIPVPAFWMLAGIWLVPILIWPLAFFLTFRKWMSQ